MNERYTDIRLLKVPIEIDNKNQLDFANTTLQYNYFNSCENIELENSSYQRKDNIIRYAGHIDDLIGYNYCMYRNTSYSEKWFYAFITDMKYVSDSMTYVYIKTDVWQTWQFDLTYKNCFIEREHVNDDTVGLHTIPENLELGEYIVESSSNASLGSCHPVIISSWNPKTELQCSNILYGVPQGCSFFVIKDMNSNGVYTIQTFLYKLAQQGKADACLGVVMVPDTLTCYSSISSWDSFETGGLIYSQFKEISVTQDNFTSAILMKSVEINKPSGIFGTYTPKNNKMKTWPFKMMIANNNNGGTAEYRFEDFSTVKCTFDVKGCISPGCSIRMYPKNYKGKAVNFEEGLNAGKFPVGSFNSDVYTNWLTQNGVNVGVGLASSAFSTLVGVATGNPLAIGGGLVGIGNAVGQIYEHKTVPPQFNGNLNAGDVTYGSGYGDFTYNIVSIKEEYAKICDDFMSMFGYKVNAFKVPNITGRTYWNYVKTIDCNIFADIPQKDLLEIKTMFDAGVTFWHDSSKFLDYSQNNAIVS